MPFDIAPAANAEDYEEFGELIREYWEWLQDRYQEIPGFIDGVGGHQALDAELTGLSDKYGPPKGVALLARSEAVVAGGGALLDLGDGSCEMKRVFVRDGYQGRGLGRRLCESLVDAAVAAGYGTMRLDTGYQNSEAIAMYTSMGFRECAPYRDYPPHLVTYLRFMEKSLLAG